MGRTPARRGEPPNLLVKIGTRGVRFNPSASPGQRHTTHPAGAFGLRVGLRCRGAGSPVPAWNGTGGREEGSHDGRSADVSGKWYQRGGAPITVLPSSP